MKKSVRKLQTLLIQVRKFPHVAKHEQNCFLDRCGIDLDHMKVINLVDSPAITWDRVADSDVVIIGGAAAYSATLDYAFTQPFTEVVLRLVDEGRPVFGSCWGHQFVARALGGEVITDRENEEVGSFEIQLTSEGTADPLFSGFPPSFMAHMGHHDRISVLPPSGIELAYSALCRNQVYRIADKPIYGTQFHAEMSAACLIERLSYFRDSYVPSEEEFESLKQNPLPTPESDRILHHFLEQVA